MFSSRGCVRVLPPGQTTGRRQEQPFFLQKHPAGKDIKIKSIRGTAHSPTPDNSVVNNKAIAVAVERPPQPSKHSPQTSINSTGTCQKHGLLGLTPDLPSEKPSETRRPVFSQALQGSRSHSSKRMRRRRRPVPTPRGILISWAWGGSGTV